ncbi:DUF1206 domain-containing protein [Antarcticibacterium arcticum]|uniref:DUF1206 domain-containing protein n=1 Tax=Antarcticibacterium arcticum TaxID=2585771 RepID=A0A5B8YJ05_9FLAO|nr:DUF1206 domain-containing protein [Antarcticibacterium arcticum]QED37038.1 DUF1206 domain-containing protein [Antarcticibacterium arcticum]
MDNSLKTIARIGYVAKGIVYGLTGILTSLAAFNMGGEKTDQLKVLAFLEEQTFGNILLALLGAGLLCYSFWRFIQSISDPENIGDDKKAKVQRIAYFISGCIYFVLGLLAFCRVFAVGGPGSGSGSGNSVQQSSWISTDVGLILVGFVGLCFIGTGIYQFVRLFKLDFVKKFQLKSIHDEKRRKTILNSAYMGMSARGIIFLIIGYFAMQAAFTADPSEIKTTMEAFSFLEDSSYGAWVLGVVAAGLVAYAIFMFMMAKYRKFKG